MYDDKFSINMQVLRNQIFVAYEKLNMTAVLNVFTTWFRGDD